MFWILCHLLLNNSHCYWRIHLLARQLASTWWIILIYLIVKVPFFNVKYPKNDEHLQFSLYTNVAPQWIWIWHQKISLFCSFLGNFGKWSVRTHIYVATLECCSAILTCLNKITLPKKLLEICVKTTQGVFMLQYVVRKYKMTFFWDCFRHHFMTFKKEFHFNGCRISSLCTIHEIHQTFTTFLVSIGFLVVFFVVKEDNFHIWYAWTCITGILMMYFVLN